MKEMEKNTHPAEEFTQEFKETQDHTYDKGYWAGKTYPTSWANQKWSKIISWIVIIALILILLTQIFI